MATSGLSPMIARLEGLKGLFFLMLAIGLACGFGLLYSMPKKVYAAQSSPFVFVDIDGMGHGSASHLGDGYFLTAGHVTQGAKQLHIRTNDGLNYSAEILWQNNEYDVAMIYVKEWQNIAAVRLSCAPNYVGQQITITGNPWDALNAKSWGRVSSIDKSGLENKYPGGTWKKLITLDIAAAPGVSGAGLINNSGELVGILVAGMVTERGVYPYTFAVPAEEICHMFPHA